MDIDGLVSELAKDGIIIPLEEPEQIQTVTDAIDGTRGFQEREP